MAKFQSYPLKRVLLGKGKRAIFNEEGFYETDDKEAIEKLELSKDVKRVEKPKPRKAKKEEE